jgi:phosphoglycerate dehydrogenase-like enzyme
MSRFIIAPDRDEFPLSDEDHAVAAAHGLEIRTMSGHAPDDFRRLGQDALGTLVWAGRYGEEILDALPNLRVVARCGAGYDNIDLTAAHARGLVVTYCPGLFDASVAEHAIAVIFALSRKLLTSDRAIRLGEWPSAGELAPIRRLEGMTLGLVGLGRIARRVLDHATALRMRVLAFDPYLAEADIPAGVTRAASLDHLLRDADVVSLHVPLTDETRHIVGASELAAMKSTAFLINTGRGGLVDGAALASALTRGEIAGAALDVFDPEPIPADHPIRSAPNTLLTPHSSAYDVGAIAAVRRQAIEDAIAVIEGRPPRHPIDLEAAPA